LTSHGLCHLDAIYSGRQDATGIAGTFAGRVEAADVEALKIISPGNSQRG
jgi:hypothetical protein